MRRWSHSGWGSPPAARSRTTMPSAATTGPGTTASTPPFAAALRAAKLALDPDARLNPGVLFDAG